MRIQNGFTWQGVASVPLLTLHFSWKTQPIVQSELTCNVRPDSDETTPYAAFSASGPQGGKKKVKLEKISQKRSLNARPFVNRTRRNVFPRQSKNTGLGPNTFRTLWIPSTDIIGFVVKYLINFCIFSVSCTELLRKLIRSPVRAFLSYRSDKSGIR